MLGRSFQTCVTCASGLWITPSTRSLRFALSFLLWLHLGLPCRSPLRRIQTCLCEVEAAEAKAGVGKMAEANPLQVRAKVRGLRQFQVGSGSALCTKETEEGCRDPACKYLHVCAVPTPEGRACGGKHPAFRHKATPRSGGRRDSSRGVTEVPGSATLQGQTGSLPGVVFSSCAAQTSSSPLLPAQHGFSSAQSALDAGRLDFDTCLALLCEVLQPAGPTYFNFGACPSLKSSTCSLYSCTDGQADLVRFVNALLLRFFSEGTWSSLWVNFDRKKLPPPAQG